MFLNKQIDKYNLDDFKGQGSSLSYYLDMTKDFKSSFKDMAIINVDGYNVIDESRSNPYGAKSRFGEYLVKQISNDEIVYVQPRVGFAGISLAYLCKKYNKKLTLVMPASKSSSEHQRLCIEMGAKPLFCRIAAMPNLNAIAAKESKENGHYFIPLGLKHELVTAGLVKVARSIPEPDEVYTVVSTAVLSRALQIAWPNAKFTAVAVARNMKAGELGRAEVISAPEPFTKSIKEEEMPPFPSIGTYDAKAWRYIPKNSGKNVLFWNVGSEPILQDESLYETVDSYRDWEKNEE